MMHPSKLNKIWLFLGVFLLGLGVFNLFSGYAFSGILNLVFGGLITYTSVYNMGGWSAAWMEVKMTFGFNPYAKKKKKNKRTW